MLIYVWATWAILWERKATYNFGFSFLSAENIERQQLKFDFTAEQFVHDRKGNFLLKIKFTLTNKVKLGKTWHFGNLRVATIFGTCLTGKKQMSCTAAVSRYFSSGPTVGKMSSFFLIGFFTLKEKFI